MNQHYLFWALGPDHSGIVASVAKILFRHQCNIEDSSMMRLGAEFGVFLIFSSPNKLSSSFAQDLKDLEKKQLFVGFKPISTRLAKFTPLKSHSFRISLHGADKPGLVYALSDLLSHYQFNISDLQTHRTSKGKKAGYIVFIEGDLPSLKRWPQLTQALAKLKTKLGVSLQIEKLSDSLV